MKRMRQNLNGTKGCSTPVEVSHMIVKSDSDNGTSLKTRDEGEEHRLWSSVSSLWAIAISPRSKMGGVSFNEFTLILDSASAATLYRVSDVNCEM